MFDTVAHTTQGRVTVRPILVTTHSRRAREQVSVLQTGIGAAQRLAGQLWVDHDFNPGALTPVLRDARRSDLVLGASPEEWSPLGKLDGFSLGRLNSTQELLAAMGSSPLRLRGHDLLPDGSAMITLDDRETPRAGIVFSSDAFMVFVPAGTDQLRIRTRPEHPDEAETDVMIRAQLGAARAGRVQRHLIWRLYFGENTARFDGTTKEQGGGAHVRLGGTRTAGVLVGRLLYSIPMRTKGLRGDPFAEQRLVDAEVRDRPSAQSCPRIEDVIRPAYGSVGKLVVAVHGTMSTALPMANKIRSLIPTAPIARFEHDTWHPVHRNAETLVAEVKRLRASHVLFIAHSRGGLVARHAAQVLGKEGVHVDVLTLGTPFAGTPIVDGARSALLGVRVLMGALRIAATSPVIDAPTRLLGWLLGGDLPDGLSDMSPSSAYLRTAGAFTVNGRAIAGALRHDYRANTYGIDFLDGLAEVAFAGSPNDLVVGTDSATSGLVDSDQFETDHFSYLLVPGVRAAIRTSIRGLPRGYVSLEAEDRHPVPVARTSEQLVW